ncbi:Similar to Malic acid transport protein; acc. no. P50537 [Pyronema omphalodes CBS 100304]|uniref:Similar to Malic acid transport protein acc. no. P50537 n=1 Tax=Pyronema omphalodes (strain CBS 100304) TaxID=1076935 RepID=U4KVU1_PYROM|nr:Similar to Malic acid transport protein; acc. no. P50537 [Pyronema omphalodes CBS 100304]
MRSNRSSEIQSSGRHRSSSSSSEEMILRPDENRNGNGTGHRRSTNGVRLSGQSFFSTHSNHSNHHINNDATKRKVPFIHRLEHFTWAWFTITMSTGGVAVVISKIPFRFRGLDEIGAVFFLLTLISFLLNSVCISIRFFRYRYTFVMTLLHPTESLFVSAGLLSVGTIIIGCQAYGAPKTGDWFSVAMRACFWTYCGATLVWTVGLHIVIWSTQTHTVADMTPLWTFPIYPMLLTAPMGASIALSQSRLHALQIGVASFAFQGVGFMISLMIYSAYIYRLMTRKLPRAAARPGMFISVGPSVRGSVDGADCEGGDSGGGDLALGSGLLVFLVSLTANVKTAESGRLHFGLGWWSFVFPNTAFVLSTFAIGGALGSHAVNVFGTVIAGILVLVWFYVGGMTIRGVINKEVLWKDKGEDRDEGGYKNPKSRQHEQQDGGGEEIVEGSRRRERMEERDHRSSAIMTP